MTRNDYEVKANFGSFSKSFVDMIKGAKKLFDEVNFKFTEDNGLIIRSLDPSRVVMIAVTLPVTVFDEYDVSEDTDVGVDLVKVAKVLSRAKAKDTVELVYGSDGMLRVNIIGKSRRSFRFAPIDVEEMELDIPDLPFDRKVAVSLKDFAEILKDAKLVDDVVKLEVTKYDLRVKAVGETNEFEAVFTEVNGEVEVDDLKDDILESVSSAFAISFLENIVGMYKFSDMIDLYVGDEMPLMLKAKMGDGDIVTLLAPRVED